MIESASLLLNCLVLILVLHFLLHLICQLHQLADHNGIYSIQKRKPEEDFNLACTLVGQLAPGQFACTFSTFKGNMAVTVNDFPA